VTENEPGSGGNSTANRARKQSVEHMMTVSLMSEAKQVDEDVKETRCLLE
jgi:hypothetical protein